MSKNEVKSVVFYGHSMGLNPFKLCLINQIEPVFIFWHDFFCGF
jgi:hypothetical protein